jgi:hypothetical protein
MCCTPFDRRKVVPLPSSVNPPIRTVMLGYVMSRSSFPNPNAFAVPFQVVSIIT